MIGKLSELQKEKNEQCTQRHELAVERLRTIVTEETVNAAYISYFQDCTLFLLELENTRKKLEDGSWDSLSLEEKRSLNRILYSDIIGEKYQTSYANQDYACEKLGQEMGQLLSLLYTEIRAGIPYVFEQRKDWQECICCTCKCVDHRCKSAVRHSNSIPLYGYALPDHRLSFSPA